MWLVTIGNLKGIIVEVHHSVWFLAFAFTFDLLTHLLPWSQILVLLLLPLSMMLLRQAVQLTVARWLSASDLSAIRLQPLTIRSRTTADASSNAEILLGLAGMLFHLLAAGFFYFALAVFAPFWTMAMVNLGFLLLALPPSPMSDGGLVLRGALRSLKIAEPDRTLATAGFIIGLVFLILGLHESLLSIATLGVLHLTASWKLWITRKIAASAAGVTAAQVMVPAERLAVFQHGTTLSAALGVSLRTYQVHFPVLHNSDFIGLIDREALISASAADELGDYVAALTTRDVGVVTPNTPVDEVLKMLERTFAPVVAVVDQGVFVGLIPYDELVHLLLVREKSLQPELDHYQTED